jgi:hypothetical protein
LRWFSPTAAQAQQLGDVTFKDVSGHMDEATVIITDLAVPEAGTHYEVWLLAQGGEIRTNIGSVEMERSGEGQLIFADPSTANLLGAYDQIEITIEPDNDPNRDESSGEVVASSVFPPLALIHVRHVDSSFGAAPNGTALVQGLLSTSESLDDSIQALQAAFESNDEAAVRKKTEEVINQIVGKANETQYKDWDEDGTVDDPGDGFGLAGYIPDSISHAKFAAEAIDATENIQANSANVVLSVENMDGWAIQLLNKALELQEMPMGADMKPVIDEMAVLARQIVDGVDSNGNETIEPIVGEGGAETAYQYAYNMAVMPLLAGAHQVPAPAQPVSE